MRNRTSAFIIILFFAAAAVFAGGRADNESHEVSNPSGFTESIDINGKKTGKWNIYLEAQDKGGNTGISGPHNIYIDPESDLPVVSIINPQQNMHVQGNLNLVGTCFDDDGVSYVEFIITKGSDGKGEILYQGRAEGREFWSFFLDTSDAVRWPDGAYTVTAWGVDINGLSGISENFPAKLQKKHQITWNLDRRKPDIKVTSHEIGALISGKVNIRGTVWDGNGISSLYYSIDDGASYQSIGLKYDKRADIYEFNLALDTRVLEDGPAIINFRSRDTMRSEGFLSFLVFANNTGPDVQILYPEPEEAVNGIFTVAGYATHSVGLASLSYKLGKETGEIPLIVGNPWWVKEFDIRGQNTKNIDLEIRAVDPSGNATVAKRRLIVDQDADRPKINLTSPTVGYVVPDEGLSLIGLATDNEGVKSVYYSIDGGQAVEIPCSGYFQLVVKDIPSGTHTMDIWAVDVTDVTGPKVQVKNIIAPGNAPEPRFTFARTGGRGAVMADFYTGMDVDNELGASLDLLISSGSPLQSVVYTIGARAPLSITARGGKGGETTISIPIPRDMESGMAKLAVTITDTYGRETVFEDYAFIVGPGGDRGSSASSFNWVRPDTSIGGGRILLSTRDPLTGVYSGGAVRSVEASGEGEEYLSFHVDEYGRVVLLGSVDGNYGPVRLNITGANGGRFTTPEYNFLVDSGPPILDILDNPNGRWVQNRIDVRLRAYDDNPLKAVEMSTDLGMTWRALVQGGELNEIDPDAIIERTLDISALADGAVVVNIRAVDIANKVTEKSFTANKDTSAPEARLIVPISGARVNGTIRLGIAIKEAGRLSSIVYEKPEIVTSVITEDDEEISNIIPGITRQVYTGSSGGTVPFNFLDVVLDANTMPLAADMSFTFADAAGNTSTLSRWPFTIDQEMDYPVLQISLPLENEVITSDFIISGVCFDDDEVRRVYWRIDEGREQYIEAKNGYSINVPLSSMTDNEHSVTIYAEDIYGVKGPPVVRNFRVSLKEPVASIAVPTAEDIVGGIVRISGIALDENGIDRVQVSLDNGNSYNDAEGDTRWTYTFNSKIIPDGNHAVFIRAWDKYDVNAIYSFLINIDNSAPELSIDTPKDGAMTTGPLYVTGQVMDNMKLESLSIKVSSLEGEEIPEELATKQAKLDSLILENLDLSSLPDGSYNVEIWAVDKAENTSRVSRNIVLAKEEQRNFVETLYPLDGEYVQGTFNLYGMAGGIDKATQVTLVINGIDVKTVDVTEAGYFRFDMGSDDIRDGASIIVVRSNFGGREMVQSEPKTLNYHSIGPWVTVDTLNMGDFAYDRPWLLGRAGYSLSFADEEILADKKADKLIKAEVLEKSIRQIELSFNNGRTFIKAGKPRGKDQKGYDWRYRLETQDMAEGLHYLIVRATMNNSEIAVSRLLIQVDKTPPVIRLISPESGGHYNEQLNYAALATDDVELKSMTYNLRQGDKARYEIPGFIKGLYFDFAIPPFLKVAWSGAPAMFNGGATFFDIGVGLSFFDDNVKVQFQYGQMTQKQYEMLGGERRVRYGGHVIGFKLLANIYTLPFGALGGPDWDWLSASFALGANFSFFDVGKQGYTQSGNPTWMAALLGQIEFPKITMKNWKYFRTFSLYTEGQLWFVPTDVEASSQNLEIVIPHLILGVRMYVF